MTEVISDPELEAIVGPVAMREYTGAAEVTRERCRTFALSLPDLSDDMLRAVCEREILDSARAIEYRGNYEHLHFRCTACYDVARARWGAAGHGDRCGGSVYDQAHARIMREQGYTPSTSGVCDCELSANDG